MEELTQHNACERLLDSDLSGHYVATNVATKYSQLVQLRRLGMTSAYTVSSAKMDLPSSGIRELQFERMSEGWRIGDPGNQEARVNILTIVRDQDKVFFRFENASDPHGFTYDAAPLRDAGAIRGDILRPEEFTVHLSSGFDAEYRFTRVKLDRSFEMIVSQSLKSLLATRLEPGSSGIADYLVNVQFKTPVMPEEAVDILGTTFIYPMDEGAGTNSPGPFYRFAVPKHIYELLEAVGHWTRRWEVAHIDAMPFRMVNVDLVRKVVDQINLAQRGFNLDQQSQQRTPPPPPPRPAPQQVEPTDALAQLQSLGREMPPANGNGNGNRNGNGNGNNHHEQDHEE